MNIRDINHTTDIHGQELVNKKLIKKLPKDPYSHDYLYLFNGSEQVPFLILSLGVDGKLGGYGCNMDLIHTNKEEFKDWSEACEIEVGFWSQFYFYAFWLLMIYVLVRRFVSTKNKES